MTTIDKHLFRMNYIVLAEKNKAGVDTRITVPELAQSMHRMNVGGPFMPWM